jgi:peptide/nickel transport system substrate-binding protein
MEENLESSKRSGQPRKISRREFVAGAGALAVGIPLFMSLPGCNNQGNPGEEQSDDYKLESYAIADSTGDWGFPSPYAHYSRGPGYMRMQFIFETLVWKSEDDYVPQLASEWEYNEDELSYTFKLREDVYWHDGTKFTADDVVFTYEYTDEHAYSWVDNAIVESVEKIDEYTVKLYLSQQYAPFLHAVAATQPVMPKHIWENVTDPDTFNSSEALIGTGPYKLSDYNQSLGTYLYTANDDYYMGKPITRELKFIKVTSEMNMASLQDGTVNSAGVTAEMLDTLEADGFTIIKAPVSWNCKLTMNHQIEPFSSKEFRQALAYAIDRQSLVDIVLRGEGVAGSPGIVPPTSVWYNPDTPQFEYNPDKSIELLEGLGYQFGDGVLSMDGQQLKVSLISASSYEDVGQFITDALEQIGIDIDFQILDGTTIDTKVGAWDFELSLYGHGGLYDPSFLKSCILGSGFNSARYFADDELTSCIEEQLTEMDIARRKEIVSRVQELYAEDMPALTLYYPDSYWAHDGDVPLYYTMDGVATGIPIPLNRMCFVEK